MWFAHTVTNFCIQRGQHDISDELVFTKHPGYVFHDSRGFENGDEDQLKIIQKFVRDRSQRTALHKRLHAIWSVLPILPVYFTVQFPMKVLHPDR